MPGALSESRPKVLIHLSDLHIHRMPRRITQWLSKRGPGALNLALNRGRKFPQARARQLVALLQKMEWDHLVITGDITQLGLPEEFRLAKQILAPLLERGPGQVTVLPGNHDRYVPERGVPAFEAEFGEFFPAQQGLATKPLGHGWWLAAWDSTEPVPLFRADGLVRRETLLATERWLAGLPADGRVVLANHYPLLFPAPVRYRRGHELRNIEEVQQWARGQRVELYLHGHLHHNWVQALHGTSQLPGTPALITVNSAASTQKPGKGAGSAFHRIVLPAQGAPQIEPIQFN